MDNKKGRFKINKILKNQKYNLRFKEKINQNYIKFKKEIKYLLSEKNHD